MYIAFSYRVHPVLVRIYARCCTAYTVNWTEVSVVCGHKSGAMINYCLFVYIYLAYCHCCHAACTLTFVVCFNILVWIQWIGLEESGVQEGWWIVSRANACWTIVLLKDDELARPADNFCSRSRSLTLTPRSTTIQSVYQEPQLWHVNWHRQRLI